MVLPPRSFRRLFLTRSRTSGMRRLCGPRRDGRAVCGHVRPAHPPPLNLYTFQMQALLANLAPLAATSNRAKPRTRAEAQGLALDCPI